MYTIRDTTLGIDIALVSAAELPRFIHTYGGAQGLSVREAA